MESILTNLSRVSIQDLKFSGPLELKFANAVSEICGEIRDLVGTEENVEKVSENLENWKLELNSFLRELQCPYEFSDRFESYEERQILIEFLCAELIAAKKIAQTSTQNDLVPIFGILHALKLSQPPSNISTGALFGKIIETITKTLPANLRNHLIR